MSTSGKLQQHHHPVLGIQVMTSESLSPLPVTGEGILSPSGFMKPLLKAAWGSRWIAPGPGTHSAARSEYFSSEWCVASPQGLQLRQWFQSGGWMSPCLQGWRRSWSNQHAALHHGQQGPKESPSDEQMMIHGWAVISIKSLGSDPRLLCRVPSRHSLSREPHLVFYSWHCDHKH